MAQDSLGLGADLVQGDGQALQYPRSHTFTFAQQAYDCLRGEELSPGRYVKTDLEVDEYVRNNAGTVYHPCGTCKMGTDKMAVVDAQARVHGIESLRVIDASIMPSIVSGNLNAPTIMMAEKLADMILGAPPLAPLDAPVWDHRTQG